MKMRVFAAVVVAVSLAVGTSRLGAQGNSTNVHVPDSSIEQPGDRGQKAHTNHVISLRAASPDAGSGPSGKWPSDISAAYSFTPGGTGTIAIVDAFDYPNAVNDFNTFSDQFSLPKTAGGQPLIQVVYANGKPRSNCGWTQESALDIEWAHATAPNAKIVLVLAKSNSFSDLFQAVDVARAQPNVRQISMSWGGSEFSGESSNDSHFPLQTSNALSFFAASGDTGGKTIYPGVSPQVVAAGGTSLSMSGGVVTNEVGWSGSGGGPSQYEPIPSYQSNIASLSNLLNGQRGVPDYSFDADPNTGVAVYDSIRCQGLVGWMVFGGTSVSSPSLAGIVNSAHALATDTSHNEHEVLYSHYGDPSLFRDILSGKAGSFSAGTGWDFVTGIGSNLTLSGK
jgi:subtilase family serine protease